MGRIEYFVPGLPVAQPRQRTRVMRVHGRPMAQNYTPTNSPVNSFKAAVRMGWPGKAVAIDGPVHLVLTFMFPRSKSKTRKVNIQEPKTGKPDIDNLIKSVADALTGLAWKDDAQIASVVAMKRTAGDGDTAGVAIRIVVAD